MPVGTPVLLGDPVDDTNNQTTSIIFETDTPIAAGDTVLALVTWYNPAVTATVAGAGLTFTKDHQVDGVADANRHSAVFRAVAGENVDAGEDLTATFSGNAYGRFIAACSVADMADSPVDVAEDATGTTAAWSVSAETQNADDLLFAFTWHDGKDAANTPAVTDPVTSELLDYNNLGNGSNASWCLEYRNVEEVDSYSMGGTWSATDGSSEMLSILIAYKALTAAGGLQLRVGGEWVTASRVSRVAGEWV